MVDAISQPGCAECGAGVLVLTDYRPYAFLRALFGGGFALCAANARVGEQRESSVHPDSAKPEERRSEPEQNFENSVAVSQDLVDLA